MGKASRKKKLIHEGCEDKSEFLKSSKSYVAPQEKEGLQKSASKATFLLFIIIILITSFSVYFNSLYNGFVYDDTLQVLENRWIKDINYLPEIFFKNVWGFRTGFATTNYYRPLMHIIYMLNYYVFGLKPWGFHLVNMLFHAGVSILVFIIVLRLFKESQPSATTSYLIPSFIAALLFATHPIHTEAVTWIAGLPDVSFTFFYLLSFYLYIRSGTEFKSSYFFSVASFFLAALCKEPALTLPVILIAYDYAVKRSEDRLSIQVKRYIPYLIMSGGYFILRLQALGHFAPLKRHAELNTYQYVINIFPLFMQYLEKLVFPINLNAFHVLHPIYSLFEPKGILSLLIALAFVVLSLFSLRKNRLIFLSLLFIMVPLLPVVYIPVLGPNSFTERYLYLPSFGFISLFALLLTWAKVNRPKVAVSLIVISTIVMGLYSLGTIRRNTIWKDDYTLSTDTVNKSPDAALPRNNLGVFLQKKGKIDEAVEQLQVALRLSPNYVDAHYNLGIALSNKGQIDEAIKQYQTALKLNPDFELAYNNLGSAFFKKGLIDKAAEQFQNTLKLNQDSAVAHSGLGTVFFNRGWFDKAAQQFQIALKLDPNLADAHNNMGVIYQKMENIDKAIDEYQTAGRLNPSNPDFGKNLAKAYELKNSIAKTKISKNR